MKHKIKPRNPFVVFAKFRKAGFHEKSGKALRRQAKLALCNEVKKLAEHWQKRSDLQFAPANDSHLPGAGTVTSVSSIYRPGLLLSAWLPHQYQSLDRLIP